MIKLKDKLPDGPGVYFFRNKAGVLYIGKATSLRDRVRSYFGKDLPETRGHKLVKMLVEATRVDYKTTDSVLEALILEATLIKKHKPHYNTDLKDDKSFNYVVITKEDFPRVLVIRGKELLGGETSKFGELQSRFGPFPHGLELKEGLKIIRKIFPYRDKCLPNNSKPCFNAQIGLCPGVCSGAISKQEYGKVIRSIKLFFEGKKGEILRGLRKHMKEEAKARNFEQAAELRNKIFALTHINDIALMKRHYLADRRLSGSEENILRIEAYDIAHISGTNTVGAMVVLVDGEPDKGQYRKFKIRTRTNDDTGSLRELLERRLRHKEWPLPDIAVIDGGPAQRAVALELLAQKSETGFPISIVNVIKNDKHKPERIVGDSSVVRDYHHDILLANSEAHRFAIAYHRALRRL
ncbi:MAG TPA: GIY-YIG nuclease family protein [Candidatus Paceibacterota bacterium]